MNLREEENDGQGPDHNDFTEVENLKKSIETRKRRLEQLLEEVPIEVGAIYKIKVWSGEFEGYGTGTCIDVLVLAVRPRNHGAGISLMWHSSYTQTLETSIVPIRNFKNSAIKKIARADVTDLVTALRWA